MSCMMPTGRVIHDFTFDIGLRGGFDGRLGVMMFKDTCLRDASLLLRFSIVINN